MSADVPEGLNEDDFASKRLMVLSDDPSVFEGKNNVIGQYGSLYLMQFDSVEAAMQAYDYYKDIVTAVEPDVPVTVASNVSTDSTEDIDVKEADGGTEQPSESDANIIEAVPEDNPINALNAMDASEDVKKAHGVIALIDTGVGEHVGVIDRVSVIDEALSGNGHGDAMADAIVSQDPEAKILSIRAMDDNGYGTVSALVAAMEYAIEQKVDIINLSLYARTTLATSVLKSEIEKATDAGIIVVGAAGNDGADVKGYMPGSVESAYIIGAAGKDGYRLVLSNYGDTVDYNVAAGSTSEASALFAGFISANGLDGVDKVLNQGLIYETGYGDGEDVVIKPSNPSGEDYSKYDVDESKSVVTRYTFADASKIEDGDTLNMIYHEKKFIDILYGTYLAYPEVYAASDGTYKIRLDAPMMNSYVKNGYQDVVFTRGNDGGNIVTEGVSFDKSTGIATITEEAFEGVSEDDYADLQVQVLAPVNDIPEQVMQDVTVVDHDGSQYTITVPVYGLDVESIPLSIEGIEGELKSDDFELYLNGEQTPYEDIYWNADEHTLYANKSCAALVESVKVVLKKDVDSVFRTAYDIRGFGPYTGYRGLGTMFWLKDGTKITTDNDCQQSLLGLDGWDYQLPNGSPIGTASFINHAGLDGDPYDSPGMVGIPKTLFGVDFTMYDDSGNPYGDWDGYNRPINGFCHHTHDAWNPSALGASRTHWFYYKIIDSWTEGKVTYYVMVFMMDVACSDTGNDWNQTLGGVVKFGVEDDGEEKTINLKVKKVWDDDDNEEGVRPSSVTIKLQSAKKVGSGSYSGWTTVDTVTLPKDDGSWNHTWTDKVRTRKESSTSPLETYKYQVVEDSVSKYTAKYKQFSFKGLSQGSTTTATVTNKIDQKEINLVAKKVWSDESNALKARPSSVKLMLQRRVRTKNSNGTWGNFGSWTDVSEKTLKKSNSWTVKWTDQIYFKGKKQYDYRVKENSVPANYKVSYEQFDIPTKQSDVNDGQKFTAKATNTLVPGYLKIHKDSELPDMTGGNKCYSLKDALYEVYTDSACTTKATYIGGPLKTDTNGDTDVIKLLPGTYWVKEKGTGEKVGGKEKSHAKGFYVDTATHKVTVTKNHTEDAPLVKKVEEPAMNDPLNITIQKIQKGPSNGNLASLENAEFTVTYYDGFFNKSNIASQTPTRVWVIKTKRVGSSNRYRTVLHEDYAVAGKCDEFYKDKHGGVVIPLGTITVQETKPAPGYVLDGNGEFKAGGTAVMRDNEMYVAQIKDAESGVNLSGGNEYTMENSTSPIHCRIEKLDGDGNKVAGVTYKIEYQQARDVYKKTTTAGGKTVTTLCEGTDAGAVLVARDTKNVYDKYGNLVGEQTTNAEGKAAFEDLYPDDYVITEIKTVNGLQLLAEPIKVSLPMRMTKAEADEWNLDTSDTTKVQWSDSEDRYIVLDATFRVTNHATFAMPMSGGTVNGWTFIPLALGMGLFVSLAFFLFHKKKRAVKAG